MQISSCHCKDLGLEVRSVINGVSDRIYSIFLVNA